MDANLVISLAFLMQAPAIPPVMPPMAVSKTAPTPLPSVAPLRCDARPWQRLVGRTVSDLLTITLPPGTRIYRIDDPPGKAVARGQLSVELARSTRVRRVYCS
jgi:hypothetical protein